MTTGFAESLAFEIASLQLELEEAQKKVTSLKRRIRGLSKFLEENTSEPITEMESDNV